MKPTAVISKEKRPSRTKAEQILDILANMTSKQVDELAHAWVEREPEHLNRFQRALREMAEIGDPRIGVESLAEDAE